MSEVLSVIGGRGRMPNLKVFPVRSAWGTIQGWSVGWRNFELAFRRCRLDALNIAHKLANDERCKGYEE